MESPHCQSQKIVKNGKDCHQDGKAIQNYLCKEGWTVTFIERKSLYWVEARAGVKTTELFAKARKTAWLWAKMSQYIRWFTDGERRYALQLWQVYTSNPPR